MRFVTTGAELCRVVTWGAATTEGEFRTVFRIGAEVPTEVTNPPEGAVMPIVAGAEDTMELIAGLSERIVVDTGT